jgi:hypothetical protein
VSHVWGVPLAMYLLPSVIVALVIQGLSHRAYLFALMVFAGTAIHELLHLLLGFFSLARPASFSLIPVRTKQGYTLGSVGFFNITWYNGAIVGLAPLLSLPIALAMGYLRIKGEWSLSWIDFAIWYVNGVLLLSCWPSSADIKIALRSWPIAAMAIGWIYWRH